MMTRATLLLTSLAAVTAFKIPVSAAWLGEAEKKHGRVALLALPTLLGIASVTQSDPILWLNSRPVADQAVFYSVAATLESLNLRRLAPGFDLRAGEQPGKLLRDTPDPPPALDARETVAGRAAMLAMLPFFFASLAVV